MNKMDSVRENRVRRMVPDPTSWPQSSHLAMKRISNTKEHGTDVEFGKLRWLPSGRIAISCDLPETLHIFENVDALIRAGWLVDQEL
jgi:hypothetical protein